MAANTIQLKGDFRLEEALASGTIYPGMLLEVTSATAHTVRVHSTEGGEAERIVAVEDALQGKTINDAYSSASKLQYHVCAPGSEVRMFYGALCSAISKGTKLISDGLGHLIPVADLSTSTLETNIIAVALEAVASPGSTPALFTVRLL